MDISIFGAAPDTGNMGVSALCYATLYNLSLCEPEIRYTVFDHVKGSSTETITISDRKELSFTRMGAVNSRRFYRLDNLLLIRFLSILGIKENSILKTIISSDAVLDISGGDSFSDIYGIRRFNTIILPKKIALENNCPLVLLPQTYGPFNSRKAFNVASKIVKGARLAWARDWRSFQVLKKLLGSSFDPGKHKCGVDVAFGLPAVKPQRVDKQLASFLDSDKECIGINISGLIYNNPAMAKKDFNFIANYNKVVFSLIRYFLKETECNICLVSHVITPVGHFESDLDACMKVFEALSAQEKKRVHVVQAFDNPCEVKWVIGQLDWFCGTRMHAAIAALSSGVPTAAISYSPKTIGVFESCGQGEHVADPVSSNDDQVVEMLWNSWLKRKKAKEIIEKRLVEIKEMMRAQFLEIIDNL
ncbi:MAG: hypothetical protein CSA26_05725 [Desulfobacterales bacterium]|nr:MAG: hypothetical protein CSA26_05725 [Desulfobacterales bacterium]